MPAYQIRPFDARSVPEIGQFLVRSLQLLSNATEGAESLAQPTAPAGDYRWLLDEDNPERQEEIPAGEVIRSDQGEIVGMIGYHPIAFRLGDRRLLALGAHNFYTDPSARMQGFILFRKYLNNPKADFCFSTTCNGNSGPLWTKCGGARIAGSDAEYLLVLRHGPILQELALRKGLPGVAAGSIRLAGPLADLWNTPRAGRNPLKLERSEDWDRLAATAEQNRDPARLTPARSPAVLRVKYEAVTRNAVASGSLNGVHRFNTPNGREGWLSLAERPRGRMGRIRCLHLLDAVRPREGVEFPDLLRAIIDLAGSRADLLSIRNGAAWGLQPRMLGLRKRTIPDPEGFLFSRANSGLPAPDELARIGDFPQAFAV